METFAKDVGASLPPKGANEGEGGSAASAVPGHRSRISRVGTGERRERGEAPWGMD